MQPPHRDPRLTTETYGHLEIDDMRIALDELAAGTTPALSGAVAASNGESFGTHLVPADPEGTARARVRPANPARTLVKTSGPSRIRTWDQSVIEQRDPQAGRNSMSRTAPGCARWTFPIPKPRIPYLVQALNDSDSELLPRENEGFGNQN